MPKKNSKIHSNVKLTFKINIFTNPNGKSYLIYCVLSKKNTIATGMRTL